jgi:hypothetical protein
MFRKMFLPLCILIFSVFPASSGAATAQPTSNPYIFYFSIDQQDFIIERADGSDSRTLGASALRSNSRHASSSVIRGPGWSPSGEWLAWSAAEELYSGEFTPHLIKADGSQIFTIADLKNPAMAWSPDRDLLLVAGEWERDSSNIYIHVGVTLLDPANNRQIRLKPETLIVGEPGRVSPAIRWIDGTRAVVSYFAGMNNDTIKTSFLLVDADKTIIERRYEGVIRPTGFEKSDLISAAGYILHQDKNALTVEDIITGEHVRFEQSISYEATVSWSPNGKYALLFDSDKVWLIDVDRVILQSISPSLPEIQSDYSCNNALWLRNSQHAVFCAWGAPHHLDISTARTERIAAKSGTLSGIAPFYLDNQDRVYLIDQADSDPSQYVLQTFDFQKKTRAVLPLANAAGGIEYYFRISPDGQSLAWMFDGPVISDLRTGNIRKFSPSANAWNTNYFGEVLWSDDGEWLLTFDDTTMTSGASRDVGIIRQNGTMRRELTSAFAWRSNHYNFLPAWVKISNLPPPRPKTAMPTPVKRLTGGDDWVLYLSWSPDGAQLVGGWSSLTTSNSWGNLWRWNVESGSATLEYKRLSGESQVRWERRPDGQYSTKLVQEQWSCISAISPDAQYKVIFETYDQGAFKLYDTETSQIVRVLQRFVGKGGCATFDADGQWLAVGTDYSLMLWNIRTMQLVSELPITTYALAFSPDGQHLAAGNGWDIDLWKVADLVAP